MGSNRTNASIVDLAEYGNQSIPGHGVNPGDFKWHLLAEGDSWFHFNRLGPQENLLQHFKFDKSTVIVNTAMSGDTIQEMMSAKNSKFMTALEDHQFEMILFSGGGNDLSDAFCGAYVDESGEKVKILKPASSMDFMDFIDTDALKKLKSSLLQNYKQLKKLIAKSGKGKNKNTKVVLHCYDYFTIRNNIENDSNRYRSIRKSGAEPKLWDSISDYLVNELAKTLLSLHDPDNNFYVIDTLRTLNRADSLVVGNSNDWRNELHPNHAGYAKIAQQKMDDIINKLLK